MITFSIILDYEDYKHAGVVFEQNKEIHMKTMKAWLQASRLPSQSYIFFPLLLGAGAWRATGGTLDWALLAASQLYGLFLQLYIVYANDWADAPIDAANNTYNIFSGGSRVIPEGKLSRRALGWGAVVMVALNLALALALWLGAGRVWQLPLVVISFALLWMYSFPPVKLSYRGGGEFLQVAGVGLVLPLVGYSLQSGELASFPWHWLAFLLPMDLAASLSTTLPDEPSDRAAGKMTFAARYGSGPVKIAIVGLYLAGLAIFVLVSGAGWLHGLMISVVPLGFSLALPGLVKDSPAGSARCSRFVTLAVATKVVWTASAAFYFLLALPRGI